MSSAPVRNVPLARAGAAFDARATYAIVISNGLMGEWISNYTLTISLV